MNRVLVKLAILLLLWAAILYAQKPQIINEASNSDSTKIHRSKNQAFFIEGGINATRFQKLNSAFKPGYAFGLTFTYDITYSIGLSFTSLVARVNTYVNKISSVYQEDNICYRQYYDFDLSFLFLELPVSLSYKIWENNTAAIRFSIGYGLSLALRDNSERTNFVLTDEVVKDYPCDYYPEGDYYNNDANFENSGTSLNAGIQIIYHRVILKVLYINKRYAIKGFDNLHSVSVNFGYIINRTYPK